MKKKAIILIIGILILVSTFVSFASAGQYDSCEIYGTCSTVQGGINNITNFNNITQFINTFDQDLNTTDNVTFHNITSTGNVTTTTGWFKGLFNWVIGTLDKYIIASFNGTTLDISINETELNKTINSSIDLRAVTSEVDPHWTTNVSAYNDSWLSTINDSYLLKVEWNATNTSYYLLSNPNNYLNVTINTSYYLLSNPNNYLNVTINTSYYLVTNPFGYFNETDFNITDYYNKTEVTTNITSANDSMILYVDFVNNTQATWIDTLFPRISELVGLLGNWSLDKTDYWNTSTNLDITTNITTTGNISANKFFGRFNWWVLNNYTGFEYLNFNDTTLNLNQNALDDRIENQTASITYNATSIATIEGTLDSGNLASVQSIDTNFYSVSEDVGASALLIQVNFTGVDTFSSILMREQYSGGMGHEINVETWNYDDSSWELHGKITDQVTMVESVLDVLDASDHVSGGLVQLRFEHQQNGNPSHDLFIDYIALQEGFTSITISQHDGLLGRDDPFNHPWAMPKNSSANLNTTGRITASELNITGISYLGDLIINADNITVNNILNKSEDFVRVWSQLVVNERVGIGTASPATKLDVNVSTGGNIQLTDTAGDGTGSPMIQSGVGTLFLKSATSQIQFFDSLVPSSDSLRDLGTATRFWKTTYTDNLYTTGSVGIGTITPQNTLNVLGDGNFTGNLTINETKFFVNALSGNVGIGTTSPVADFQVAESAGFLTVDFTTFSDGTDYTQLSIGKSHSDTIGTYTQTIDGEVLGALRFEGVDSGSNADFGAIITATQNGASGSRVPTDLIFSTANTNTVNDNQLVLHHEGNVGIGTASPSNLLEVRKDQNAVTEIIINNNNSGGSARARLSFYEGATLQALTQYMQSANKFQIWTASDQIILSPAGLDAMILDASQNVDVLNDLTAGTIQADDGFTGYCVNTTYTGGIATSCND